MIQTTVEEYINNKLNMNKIIHWDCIDEMSKLQDESIDLCIIDPPYNVNYKYNDYTDNMAHKDYIQWQIDIIQEIECKLKWGWALVYISYPELSAEIFTYFKYNSLILQPIKLATWVYNTNLWWKYLRKASRWIILFSKWELKNNNITGEYKNPTDKRIAERIRNWEKPKEMDWFYINQVKNVSKKHSHPCELPQELLTKFIKWLSNEWDTVLDCFAWSGSLWLACESTKRNYILIERDKNYIDIINQRLNEINNKTL